MARPRKPVHLKAVSNTAKGAEKAPKLPLTTREVPGFLSESASRFWPELAAVTADMGTLSDADRLALGLLCEALDDWHEARAQVAAVGATYRSETESGNVMYRANPAVAMRNDAARRAQSLLTQFGLTPSARASLGPLPGAPDDDDPAGKYLD
mgnify:CR=1 FL=1